MISPALQVALANPAILRGSLPHEPRIHEVLRWDQQNIARWAGGRGSIHRWVTAREPRRPALRGGLRLFPLKDTRVWYCPSCRA
jgi:hypothetical protein